MPYTPTTWTEGVTKLGPTNMNHLETGVSGATTTADAAIAKPATPASNDGLVWNGSTWTNAKLVNANIDPAAAIAYSKLSLALSILNADISASAAIAYSKLSLTGAIVNADVSASAAIAASKLALFNLPYLATFMGQSLASAATANTAYYMPIVLYAPLTVTSFKFFIGTQSGNYDVGIYDSTFAKVWSKGSTATPVSGSATVLISAGTPSTLTLQAGVYYLAHAFDNGTATRHISTGAGPSVGGIALSKGTSFPLPASLAGGSTPPPDGHGLWAAIV